MDEAKSTTSSNRGIVTTGLRVSFGRYRVLDGFSFEVPAGSVTLLAGLNGAGKTTWIRTALGLIAPNDGQVLFSGAAVGAVRQRVGVVMDEPPVYPGMSGRENLRILSGDPPRAKIDEQSLFEVLGLSEQFLGLKGGEYSLGQRRRLAIVAAVIRKPSYLFLDEPTIGLDPMAWSAVRDTIRKLADDGCSVVLTGQDFSELTSVVDRVCVLSRGHAVFSGTGRELRQRRKPRVWVMTDDVLSPYVRGWEQIGTDEGPRFECVCSDEREARELLRNVRMWDVELRAAGVREDTLEEAFLSVLAADSGER